MLTAEQRYRQARQKARMISRRNLEAMLRGERLDSGPCTMDLERKFIIAEIDRAITTGDRNPRT
jgi:hypothetical protein